MSLAEQYDDSEDRGHSRHNKPWTPPQWTPAPTPPVCAYCAPAIKGGAPGTNWHEAAEDSKPGSPWVRHWIRITSDTGHIWTLESACGRTFHELVDSGD